MAPAARRDLIGIRESLLQRGSGRIAQAKQRAIEAALKGIGPISVPLQNRCERLVASHTILYRVSPDAGDNATAGDVFVLRVFGAGQSRDRL